MRRLLHSSGGMLRSTQISKSQIFAFVEGGLDRPFIEKILFKIVPDITKFRVIAIKEITKNELGGKIAVLNHFKSLRRSNGLNSTAWGKKFINLFFLDKDVDDALNKKIRSPHVAYTSTYDVEGLLFFYGDIIRAISDACLITTAQASNLIGNSNQWIKEIVYNWSDWITLCMISQYKKKNLGCTFDQKVSKININPLAPPNAIALQEFKQKLHASLEITNNEFDLLYSKFYKKVTQSIKEDNPFKYFKGKWLAHLIQKQCEMQPRIPDSNMNGIGDRAISILVSQVASNDECTCYRHYSPFLITALTMLHE